MGIAKRGRLTRARKSVLINALKTIHGAFAPASAPFLFCGELDERAVLAMARSRMQLRGGPIRRDFRQDRHEIPDPEFLLLRPVAQESGLAVLKAELVALHVPFHPLGISGQFG